MRNYWLDQKLRRLEARWKRAGIYPYSCSLVAKNQSCKLELRQLGKVVVPYRKVEIAERHNGTLVVKYSNPDQFPMSGYQWLANEYKWCRNSSKSGPIEANLKVYQSGEIVREETVFLALDDMSARWSCDDHDWSRLELELFFRKTDATSNVRVPK